MVNKFNHPRWWMNMLRNKCKVIPCSSKTGNKGHRAWQLILPETHSDEGTETDAIKRKTLINMSHHQALCSVQKNLFSVRSLDILANFIMLCTDSPFKLAKNTQKQVACSLKKHTHTHTKKQVCEKKFFYSGIMRNFFPIFGAEEISCFFLASPPVAVSHLFFSFGFFFFFSSLPFHQWVITHERTQLFSSNISRHQKKHQRHHTITQFSNLDSASLPQSERELEVSISSC